MLLLGYKRWAELDFLTQLDVVKALKIFLKLDASLTDLVSKISRSEVYVKVFGDFEFNILGIKHRNELGFYDVNCEDESIIFDLELYNHFMTDYDMREKGFTLKMSTTAEDNKDFQEMNKQLMARFCREDLVSFVRQDNLPAIKFTEKSGFVKFIGFENNYGTKLFGFLRPRD